MGGEDRMNAGSWSGSSRRELLSRGLACGAGAMMAAREFIVPAAVETPPRSRVPRSGASDKLLAPRPDHPRPAAFDRLDEAWYRATVGRLQERMREAGLDAVILTDRWNIIY